MAEPKTKKNDASVEAFLHSVDKKRQDDCFALLELMREATGAEATMWGSAIVGFGEYRYTYAGGRTGDWPVIAFSPRKQNLTLYLSSGFDGYDDLLAKLGKHSVSKACLYIKRLADVDTDVLRQLVEASVAHTNATNG